MCWIFESPDEGKTMYRRRFGEYSFCELVEEDKKL